MKLKPTHLSLVLSPLILLAACSNPADGTAEATVNPPGQMEATISAVKPAAPTGKPFSLQPSSKIEFVGSKVTGSHSGGFSKVAGEFFVEEGKLASSGHRIVIDNSSLWTDTDRLTGHLKNADFFDVANNPLSTFVATAIEQTGTDHKVSGDLTLHGVTRNISFPAQVTVSDNVVKIAAEFHIDRYDFEMKYAGQADNLIRKEVVIKLNVEASPGKTDFTAFEAAAKSGASL
jgi:polyisoprenoid-binding protein YceI